MGNEWLTGRRGQALAVVVSLLVVLAVWVAAVQPLLAWYREREETLAQRTALADRMEALAASLPALRQDARADAPGRSTAGRATLEGASDAVAGATLQERVQAMAASAGASLSSVETLPAEQAGAWRRIALRVNLTASWPVLVRLLAAVDEASPSMLVDDLHMHSTLLVAHPVALPLQTSFSVYAFRSGGASVASRP